VRRLPRRDRFAHGWGAHRRDHVEAAVLDVARHAPRRLLPGTCQPALDGRQQLAPLDGAGGQRRRLAALQRGRDELVGRATLGRHRRG
jgi:hypothetical protein